MWLQRGELNIENVVTWPELMQAIIAPGLQEKPSEIGTSKHQGCCKTNLICSLKKKRA
jgi:hypothetical protein